MASPRPTLVSPNLFSKRFGVSPDALGAEGLFDPILNSDSKVFIDPLLIAGSDVPYMRVEGHQLLRKHLGDVVELVAASKVEGDIAWRSANNLLNLKERRETCLGYGGASTSGSSRPKSIRQTILRTTKEIVDLGMNDPEIITLMGVFEEGVGADTISDLTTNAIFPALCKITEDFCKKHSVPTSRLPRYPDFDLPENPYTGGMPVILVPRDILRDLPLAADMADVSRVIFENQKIRQSVNALLAGITKASVTEKKEALRTAALSSLDNFKAVFNAILHGSDSYDPHADPLGIYGFRRVMAANLAAFHNSGFPPPSADRRGLAEVVAAVIDRFRYLVERNNLWELLWVKATPKKERAAQLLFFAVADMFCQANNIDVSPETNPGGGPVDFKFSMGYRNRIIVEIKLSKGRVEHGYKHQTEVYAQASRTDNCILLVVNVGGMGKKLANITKTRETLLSQGKPAPSIEVVDGRRRQSASKRPTVDDVIEDDVPDDDEEDDEDDVLGDG